MLRYLTLAGLILICLPAFATAELLDLSVWCELEPMAEDTGGSPLSREEARKRLLEEARFLISGMIYGMEFTYTPYDKSRHVAEFMELKPVAEIPWGDANLRIVSAEERNRRLFARLRYQLLDFQEARRKAWQSNTIPESTGDGEASLFIHSGLPGKKLALQEAAKNAIRSYLRPRIFNKPREINGTFLIWEAPSTISKSGQYLTRVKIKLNIEEVRPYGLF